jgi:hypothetical protein
MTERFKLGFFCVFLRKFDKKELPKAVGVTPNANMLS